MAGYDGSEYLKTNAYTSMKDIFDLSGRVALVVDGGYTCV